jgi:hypothetical protein
LLSATCRSPDEAHIRALLLQGLVGGAWHCVDSTVPIWKGPAACW